MKKLYLLTGALAFCLQLFSQTPAIEWQKSLGGPGVDWALSVDVTSDHGYILVGNSDSIGGQVTANHGDEDIWVVKLNSAGTLQWQKSLGGTGRDQPSSVQQTTDGGYIIAGLSSSNNGDVTGNHGGTDFWVVKLDGTGNIQWQKSLGGDSADAAQSVKQTNDGGYIVAGVSYSHNGNVTGNHGNGDFWVVKLDSAGNLTWQKALGGTGYDYATGVQQTADGGYFLGGNTWSNDGNVTGNHGNSDFWVAKLDAGGNISWQSCYGGSGADGLESLQQTTDGGYILAGLNESGDGQVTVHHGHVYIEDEWIVKINSTGGMQWQKSLGGTGQDIATSIQQTLEGGYIIGGYSTSIDVDITAPMAYTNIYENWVVKLNANGSIDWDKSLGGADLIGTDYDAISQIKQLSDSSFVFTGPSHSNDGEISGNHGDFDFSVFKLYKAPPPCLVLSATNTNFDCTRFTDTTTITLQSGIPDSINWGDGVSYSLLSTPLLTHYYTQPGNYNITLVDASGCAKTLRDTLRNLGVSIDTIVFIHPTCDNVVTGSIRVIATGGHTPYTYLWTTGATTDSINNLTGGDYAVSVTDNTGCLSKMHYNLYRVNNNPGYYVYCNVTNPNCTNNGAVATSVYNGVPPYTYAWNNGRTTPNITGLAQAIYTVTVTDSTGCVVNGAVYLNASCNNLIYGTLFNDLNHNCVIDSTEQSITHIAITATDSVGIEYYGWADSNGHYVVSVPHTGSFNMSAGIAYMGTCTSSQFCGTNPVTFNAMGDTSYNNNFAINFSGVDLQLYPGWATVPPCAGTGYWQKWYWIYVYNRSPLLPAGPVTVTFQFDSALSLYSLGTPHYTTYNQATRTFTWVLDSVGTLNYQGYIGPIQFNYRAGYQAGYQMRSQFSITPYAGDCDTSNNNFDFIDSLLSSHDPNEKLVEPAGDITENDSILTYTINFQNTGNDTARFIIIKDTLSAVLQPASVKNIASSLPYTSFDLTGTGILTWVFNPANLPDSLTNPAGSNGFIKFKVKKKNNLQVGTVISNKASIYFDYNPAVVTNTVTNTITSPLSVLPVNNEAAISVNALPNPFSNQTEIVVTGLNQKYDFELYDLTGRLVKRVTAISTNTLQLNRDGLTGGVYLYGIKTGGKNVAFGKLVVQ